jgi:hypothetical protein
MSNNPRARVSCRPLLFRHSPLPQLIEVSRESTAPTGTGSASRRGRQAERVNVRTFSHLFAPFPHLVHTLEMACLQGKHGQEAISLFGVRSHTWLPVSRRRRAGQLLAKEWELLVALAEDPERVFKQEDVLRDVWGGPTRSGVRARWTLMRRGCGASSTARPRPPTSSTCGEWGTGSSRRWARASSRSRARSPPGCRSRCAP